MHKLALATLTVLLISGQALAQTPTPIQRRSPPPAAEPPRLPPSAPVDAPLCCNKPKAETAPPPTAKSVTVKATPTITQDMSYCANSMRVFKGIVTYNPEYQQFSVNFRYKLCFTDGKELYKINRIFLVPSDPLQYNQFFWTSITNQPVRVMLFDYKVIHIDGNDELVATRFDIVKDD